MKLLIRRSWTGVDVTDAVTGTWVANVFGFRAASGPYLRHNHRYRTQFGIGPYDPHGSEARREVCNQAKRVY